MNSYMNIVCEFIGSKLIHEIFDEFIAYEFIVSYSYMNSKFSWIHIWIWHYEIICYEFVYEYDTMNSCCLNSCIWIQSKLWIHIHEFRQPLNSYTWIQTTWIHSVIFIYEFIVFSEFVYMNSDTMNS